MAIKRVPKMRVHASHEADSAYGYLGCLLVDGDRVYATGGTHGKPTLLVSDDGARSWRTLSTPKTSGLRNLVKEGDALYLLGEYGTLAASLDFGLTWTKIPTDHEACLFDLARTSDGTWWVSADGGLVLRSKDGIAYQPVELDTETRMMSITVIDGAMYVLGYDGKIRTWDGNALRELALDGNTPLTALIATRAGSWLVTGDGGGIFRSTDKGASWETIEVATADDLEAILEIPSGIVIVGDTGTLLFSDDDGKSWTAVPTELDGHLWCIVPFGSGYLISSDQGAIWSLDVSATETIEIDLDAVAEEEDDDEEDDDDDDDDEDDDEEDEEEEVAPATFASIQDASERWIREGKAFSDGLNAYVRRVYAVGPNKAGDEPSETRRDMASYVREQLIALNAAGDHQKARQLFPPAYEPFERMYDALGQSIDQLAYLRDGGRIARIGAEVYALHNNQITLVEGIDLFGQSHDRRWVAKGIEDRLEISDGWDGKRVRMLPRGAADVGVTSSLTVAPDGEAVLAATESGIYWITERGQQRLLPDEETDSVSYPHAALSPNGRFVALGTQDSSHQLIDRQSGRRYAFDPVSSYPHFAAFHHDRPHMVFNSCHGLYGSATLAVDLDRVITGKPKQAAVLDRRAWVYCAATTKFGYLLGDRSGYIWAFDFDGNQQWSVFVGSTLTAMDLSPDRTKLLVGSFAGIVIELDVTAKTPDPRLLTEGPVSDVARWLFWQGHDPMIW